MHHRIVSVLRRFRNAPAQQLDRPEILDACRQVNHTWRTCLLDPVAIIHLFLSQILHGNTAINHLVRISGLAFTASAYCQARSRLPLAVFQELLHRVAQRLRPEIDETATWHGHRVFVADGSSFSMPDDPELQEHFGQPSVQRPGCGFPVAHLLALFHVGTGMLLEVVTAPLCTHDMSGVARIHPQLRRRRRPAGRPRLLFVRASGAAPGARRARRLPHPSASDRRLHPATGPCPIGPQDGRERAPAFALASGFGPDRPGGCLAQARAASRVDDRRSNTRHCRRS